MPHYKEEHSPDSHEDREEWEIRVRVDGGLLASGEVHDKANRQGYQNAQGVEIHPAKVEGNLFTCMVVVDGWELASYPDPLSAIQCCTF